MTPVPQPETRLVFTTGPRLRINDATIAAALMTAGHNLLAVSRASNGRGAFWFADTPSVHTALDQFIRNRARVIALRERVMQPAQPRRAGQ